MFQSPRNALIFAACVAVGAVIAVGGEDNPGTVVETSEDLAAQRNELREEMESDARLSEDADSEEEFIEDDQSVEDEDVDYADDEDLIDDATGIDPTPDAELIDDGDEFAD